MKLQKREVLILDYVHFIMRSPRLFRLADRSRCTIVLGAEPRKVFTFLMEYENYSFPEAVKVLADRAGVELPEMCIQGSQRAGRSEEYAAGDQ